MSAVFHLLKSRWEVFLLSLIGLAMVFLLGSLLMPAPEYPLMLEHTAMEMVSSLEDAVVSVENLDKSPVSATMTQQAGFHKPRKARVSGKKEKLPPPIVNINTATVADLDQLPGIGPKYAERIIEYRAEHGPFSSVEQLLDVKGIGPKKLEKMAPYVKL